MSYQQDQHFANVFLIHPKETESLLSHDCEYQSNLAKAERNLQNKNNQIITLNKIIKSLRLEVKELQKTKCMQDMELKRQSEEIAQLRMKGIIYKGNDCTNRFKQRNSQHCENVQEIFLDQSKNREQEDIFIKSQSLALKTYKICSPAGSNKEIIRKIFEKDTNIENNGMNLGELIMGKKLNEKILKKAKQVYNSNNDNSPTPVSISKSPSSPDILKVSRSIAKTKATGPSLPVSPSSSQLCKKETFSSLIWKK